MAVRISAPTTYLSRNSSLPSPVVFTMCCWFYLVSDTNASGNIFELVDSGGTNYKGLWIATDGTTLQISRSGVMTSGTSLSITTWYHIAFTCDGVNSKSYLNGVQDATVGDSASFTSAFLLVGSNSVSNVDARFAAIKVWDAALSISDIQNEQFSILPRRTANLNCFTPVWNGSDRLTDYSGLGRNWTANGSLTDEAQPPVSWGMAGRRVRPATAAPITFEQEGYRWRFDDGNEASASYMKAQDTPSGVPRSRNVRLRAIINAGGNPPTENFKLQFRKVGQTDWRDVIKRP